MVIRNLGDCPELIHNEVLRMVPAQEPPAWNTWPGSNNKARFRYTTCIFIWAGAVTPSQQCTGWV